MPVGRRSHIGNGQALVGGEGAGNKHFCFISNLIKQQYKLHCDGV